MGRPEQQRRTAGGGGDRRQELAEEDVSGGWVGGDEGRAAGPALPEIRRPLRILPQVDWQVVGPDLVQQEGLDPRLYELPAGLLR